MSDRVGGGSRPYEIRVGASSEDRSIFLQTGIRRRPVISKNQEDQPMKLSVIFLVAALAAAGTVRAQTPDGSSPPSAPPSADLQAVHRAVMQACAADINSQCPGKKRHELMMCLRSNADKLSAGCNDAMSKLPQPPGRAAPAQ